MKIAVPNKGRLSDSSIELLAAAGYTVGTRRRSLSALCSDGTTELLFARASDVPQLIKAGVVDLGITGRDLALESGAELNEVLALGMGCTQLALAGPPELKLRKGLRIATSFPTLAERLCPIEATFVELDGAIELAPKLGLADAIIDLVSSGETLRSNGLELIETLLETESCLFAAGPLSKDAEVLVHACESVLAARGKRFLLANVPKARIEAVQSIVPGLNGPTQTAIFSDVALLAIQVVVDQDRLPRVIYDLKALGASGILVTKLEWVIY